MSPTLLWSYTHDSLVPRKRIHFYFSRRGILKEETSCTSYSLEKDLIVRGKSAFFLVDCLTGPHNSTTSLVENRNGKNCLGSIACLNVDPLAKSVVLVSIFNVLNQMLASYSLRASFSNHSSHNSRPHRDPNSLLRARGCFAPEFSLEFIKKEHSCSVALQIAFAASHNGFHCSELA